ncbi:MAG: D-tyrosyl-tRNA(Tyr) deacylase [Armatimonadetes bacterium]|nr:D-tyrosyl-tRNA(Tyr) deacylase [Armatimonadota bacterium]
MRAVVQRVTSGRVTVDGRVVGSCGPGFVLLVAAGRDDTVAEAKKLADRVWGMRVFADAEGKINLNLRDREALVGADLERANVLAVPNFTVYGDATQRRPSFGASAPFEQGKGLFDAFVTGLVELGARVQTGEFGADMLVDIVNDGPVTVIAES